jgi:hypothetical protein
MFEYSYCDLRAEQALAVGNNQPVEGYAEVRAGVRLEVLALPAVNRAGVAWGADAVWLDASTCADALALYDSKRFTL